MTGKIIFFNSDKFDELYHSFSNGDEEESLPELVAPEIAAMRIVGEKDLYRMDYLDGKISSGKYDPQVLMSLESDSSFDDETNW